MLEMTFVKFDIYQMAWSQKLYFVNFTYFSKVKDTSPARPTVVNAPTSVTSASTVLREAP